MLIKNKRIVDLIILIVFTPIVLFFAWYMYWILTYAGMPIPLTPDFAFTSRCTSLNNQPATTNNIKKLNGYCHLKLSQPYWEIAPCNEHLNLVMSTIEERDGISINKDNDLDSWYCSVRINKHTFQTKYNYAD